MVASPVFGVTAAEKAAKADGGAQAEGGEGATPAVAGGLTLRDYQLEVRLMRHGTCVPRYLDASELCD